MYFAPALLPIRPLHELIQLHKLVENAPSKKKDMFLLGDTDDWAHRQAQRGQRWQEIEGPPGQERQRRQDLPPGSSKALQSISLCEATALSFFLK